MATLSAYPRSTAEYSKAADRFIAGLRLFCLLFTEKFYLLAERIAVESDNPS